MLKRNLIANYFDQGWVALMSFAFIPIYIKYLGIESYGLIGLFALMQAWCSLLDLGMSPALNREMSRHAGGAQSSFSVHDTLRSIEVVMLFIVASIVLGVWISSGWLARNWLQSETLPIDTISQSLSIMGIVIALRFAEGIYRSAIIGMQRQVLFSAVNSLLATLRSFGALAILIWISSTIQAFFIWQSLISFLSLSLLIGITYRALPRAKYGGKFSIAALREVGAFAFGMMGLTLLSLLLMQSDKIILSKLLSLSEFGRYTLASVFAGALYMTIAPIGQAWFPKLVELQAGNHHAKFTKIFHQGAQMVSVCMGSTAIVIIVFSENILQIWTGDYALASRSAVLLSLLTLGNFINGLMWIPYQAQLAHGWTGLATRINISLILFVVPAYFLIIPSFGPEGAAWVWVCVNLCYFLVGPRYMYQKILIGEMWQWYWNDVLRPLIFSAAIVIFLYWVMPADLERFSKFAWILSAGLLALVTSILSANYVLQEVLSKLKQVKYFR